MFAYVKSEQKQASKSTIQKKEAEKKTSSMNLTGIPDKKKTDFENFSGFSFDDVRVHYNSDKPAQLQALAYTQGNQVYVASRQEMHLEHESGHVVQQKQGIVKPTKSIDGLLINDNQDLEQKADIISLKAENYSAGSDSMPVVQMVGKRSNNPYNHGDGIVSHHIIPHELLESLIDKYTEKGGTAIEIQKKFIPDIATLSAKEITKQGTIKIILDDTKLQESDTKLSELASVSFQISGKEYNLEGLKAEIERYVSEKATKYPEWFTDLSASFFEWSQGNLFYGKTRNEPGESNSFDSDAALVPGMDIDRINKLKLIYDSMRNIDGLATTSTKDIEKILDEFKNEVVGKPIPKYNTSLWIDLSPDKFTIFNTIYPERQDIASNTRKNTILRTLLEIDNIKSELFHTELINAVKAVCSGREISTEIHEDKSENPEVEGTLTPKKTMREKKKTKSDKMLFTGSLFRISEKFIKIGNYEKEYGDIHHQRSARKLIERAWNQYMLND